MSFKKKSPLKDIFSVQTILVLLAIIFLVILALLRAQQAEQVADTILRRDILEQAQSIAQAIDPDLVKALSFTPADTTRPEFLRIRQQMQAYAKFMDLRIIYSVAAKNNALTFGPETLAATDPLASPPGTLYKKPPAGLARIFKETNETVVGPYTDEYGTFVSAFSPLLDPRSGEVLLVIGIDIPFKQWESTLKTAKISALVPLFSLAFLFFIVFIFLRLPKSQMFLKKKLWTPYEKALYLTLFGLSLTIVAAHSTYSQSKQNINDSFSSIIKDKATNITANFRNIQVAVDTLSSFFENSEFVNASEFDIFAQHLVKSSTIQALEWVPILTSSNSQQPNHYPLIYISPMQGNEAALGFNLGSEKSRLNAINEAMLYKLPTASTPLTLVQETQQQQGVLLFHPVIKADLKAEGIKGFVIAVIRIQSVLNAYFDTNTSEKKISIKILDISHTDRHPVLATISEENLNFSNNTFAHSIIYPIFFGGQTYALVAYDQSKESIDSPWLAAVATFIYGAIITAIIAAFVAVLSRKEKNLQILVDKKTEELQESETKYRALFEKNKAIMLLIVPDTGAIILANSAACEFYGWPNDEFLQKNIKEINTLSPKEIQMEMNNAINENKKHFNFKHRLANGDLRDVEVFSTPIRDTNNIVLCSIIIDVTEKLHAKKMLQETNHNLEIATAAKSEFLANMSHEIRTPMNAIIGMAQLLLRSELNRTQHRYAEIICSSGDSLLCLVSDILDYSKIEANKLTLEAMDFHLAHVSGIRRIFHLRFA